MDDPRTWTTFANASKYATDGRLGFILGDGIGGIDLDDCVRGGRAASWAQQIIDQHRNDALLIEMSPSGNGVHIILPMLEGPGRRIWDGEVKIEVYSRARYFTMTGKGL